MKPIILCVTSLAHFPFLPSHGGKYSSLTCSRVSPLFTPFSSCPWGFFPRLSIAVGGGIFHFPLRGLARIMQWEGVAVCLYTFSTVNSSPIMWRSLLLPMTGNASLETKRGNALYGNEGIDFSETLKYTRSLTFSAAKILERHKAENRK